MKYIVVSGYYSRPGNSWAPAFYRLWWRNLMRYADPKPERVFIISSGRSQRPPWRWMKRGEWIELTGNLGHCDDLLNGHKPFFMPACPTNWMIGAWLAYQNECDLISLEQDALVFGPWVKCLYSEIGDKGFICGKSRMQGAATSLFLVRHSFIPQFVADYLAEGPETRLERIAETKVHRLTQRKLEDYATFSFGCDKDRPLTIKGPGEVFFGQKFTRGELLELEQHGLISCRRLPKVPLFSNHV